jgi:von Willebrand factor type A domain
MVAASPLHFDSPAMLATALIGCGVAIAIGWIRHITVDRFAGTLLAIGLILIALATGNPLWRQPQAGVVSVAVDLSPSTRGASFRDRAWLDRRIHALLGDTRYDLTAFADGNHPLPTDSTLADIPADHTRFSPPAATAILLFSDGQFDLPATAPPTFAVIDPALDHPADAKVSNLEFRDGHVVATIDDSGSSPRTLTWAGATAGDSSPISASVVRTATPAARAISATLSSGDPWPENDSLSINPAPATQLERWWIGARDGGDGWRHFRPNELPTDPASYLNAGAIVLDNIPADALSAEQRDRLGQYARDLGGAIVIVGGDHAFGAGGYDGDVLDAISPLASSPPQPSMLWILLIDGSGSMADIAGGSTSKWQIESAAVTHLLPSLPPADLVSVGSFAETVNWWSKATSAHETLALPLPPPSAVPRGPTNLQPALQGVIASTDGSMPVQLLIMTDAQTQLTDASTLASAMNAKKIHLQVLALGHGDALPALQQIASATGGSVVEQLDPQQWTTSARQLMQAALTDRLLHERVVVQFIDELGALGSATTDLWNRTWLKSSATLLAKNDSAPMAARWQLGLGRVAAIAYPADVNVIKRVAHIIAQPPRDPRFSVTWQSGPMLHVMVDAIDKGSYLNGEHLQLDLSDLSTTPTHVESTPIAQTAPGRYEADVPSPRTPVIATVRDGPRVLERIAVAGRYPPEFEAIGNDRAKLLALARRTGGGLIDPASNAPIDFHWPVRERSLTSLLATLGAAFIAWGLIRWKRAGN